MTMIKFQCPNCGGPLEDPGQGATIRCPYCSASFLAPPELIAARSASSGEPGSQPAASQAKDIAEEESPSPGEFFEDDFSDPGSGWDVGARSDGVMLSYENGSYRIFLSEDDTGWESYVDDEYTDFELEVEVAKFKGPKDGEYGVTCRVGDDGSYSFWLTGEGYYGIGKLYYGDTDDDEEYVELAEGKAGFMQLSSSFNRLRAVCVGDRLTMYLNGKKVLEVKDNEFDSGDIGLMASTGESAKGGLDVRFKNLAVRAP